MEFMKLRTCTWKLDSSIYHNFWFANASTPIILLVIHTYYIVIRDIFLDISYRIKIHFWTQVTRHEYVNRIWLNDKHTIGGQREQNHPGHKIRASYFTSKVAESHTSYDPRHYWYNWTLTNWRHTTIWIIKWLLYTGRSCNTYLIFSLLN
jgi:hypothetical protein